MTDLGDESGTASSPVGPADTLGWAFGLAAVAYAVLIHHGVGPAAAEVDAHWARPTGFLLRSDALALAFDGPGRALAIFGLPALALAGAIFAASQSAIARALGLCCCVATWLFLFYGVAAPRPWAFFEWRGSAALMLTAGWIGIAAAAPWLAARWLELGAAARVATYVPLAFAAVAFIRNTTGTDPTARFSLSPWPAVPVFGIEVTGVFLAAAFLGIAVATAGLGAGRPERSAARRIALGALGLAIPVSVVSLGSALALFPFALGAPTLLALSAVSGLAIAAVAAVGVRGDSGSQQGRALAVAAALIAAPLVVGETFARVDYHVTREDRAQRIITALDHYYAREQLYPDALAELVESGDLDAVPTPAIGFRFLGGGDFHYQSFGTSYLLDFAAPRWVECAYSPPYDDEEDGSEDVTDAAEEPLGGSWSCPSEPPELW